MKTISDCWVVGKKSDQREFYVVINQKNANLIEINGEFILEAILDYYTVKQFYNLSSK